MIAPSSHVSVPKVTVTSPRTSSPALSVLSEAQMLRPSFHVRAEAPDAPMPMNASSSAKAATSRTSRAFTTRSAGRPTGECR